SFGVARASRSLISIPAVGTIQAQIVGQQRALQTFPMAEHTILRYGPEVRWLCGEDLTSPAAISTRAGYMIPTRTPGSRLPRRMHRRRENPIPRYGRAMK